MFDQDQDETKPGVPTFDFDAFPGDTLFHDRREGRERRSRVPTGKERPADGAERPARERREKKERRRRIDPTTFEKQYTDDELEFMNAMQRFKVQSGKSFPSHGEVLKVAFALGYRKAVPLDPDEVGEEELDEGAQDSSPNDVELSAIFQEE